MARPRRRDFTSEGCRLSLLDWGGHQDAVLLLHGLAGGAAEWTDTARWLSERYRVVALDQRGHGHSAKGVPDLSHEAFVRDAAKVIRELGLGRVIVIGQSFGALIAMLLAALRPRLVKALVVIEGEPGLPPDLVHSIEDWLDSWPVPFRTRQDAVSFFGGENLKGRTWAAGLEQRRDGLWPVFKLADMLAIPGNAVDRWAEWRSISCPALIVCGAHGIVSHDEMRRMAETARRARYVEIPEAGHDLHLEQPRRWRRVLEGFLATIP